MIDSRPKSDGVRSCVAYRMGVGLRTPGRPGLVDQDARPCVQPKEAVMDVWPNVVAPWYKAAGLGIPVTGRLSWDVYEGSGFQAEGRMHSDTETDGDGAISVLRFQSTLSRPVVGAQFREAELVIEYIRYRAPAVTLPDRSELPEGYAWTTRTTASSEAMGHSVTFYDGYAGWGSSYQGYKGQVFVGVGFEYATLVRASGISLLAIHPSDYLPDGPLPEPKTS